MQLNSIPEPVRVENERTPTPFPASGNNFVTVFALDDSTDTLALLEAVAFLHDCEIALAEFERLPEQEKRTGTVGAIPSVTSEPLADSR